MNRLPQRLLLSVASVATLALPLPASAGTAKPTCGAAPSTAATPLMSRHAALKLQAEAELLGSDRATCTGADKERDTDDDTAGGHAADSEDRHARHSGGAAMCPIAAVLPGLDLSQYRHMPPRSPLGTLAGATADSLFLSASARC